ncbi:MAG: CvpA family protein, partial [Pseudomonadota bacterium]|nr:CvpA family protein [Pseudomonadota bacterium]
MVIGIVGLSTILAFWHGFVRVIASLATWVVAVLAGIHFSDRIGTMLPVFGETPGARYVAAFALIMVCVLIVGALIGFLLSRLVSAVGLG